MYLANMFEQCSRIVSVELLQKLQEQKCVKKTNICKHFDKMHAIWEQLSSLGQAPSDESFVAIILGLLPASYDPHISALTALAKVLKVMLTSDMLMSTIVDKYDWQDWLQK